MNASCGLMDDGAASLLALECVGEHRSTSYRWRQPRSPPTEAQLAHCGFPGATWAASAARDDPNLLLLLHGLGDNPAVYARFAAQLRLPQTSALALPAPLPLPQGLPGRMWCESFSEDGSLIDGSSAKIDQRRLMDSLANATRVRLLRLLRLLVDNCGWKMERVFIFGYAQGGSAALDLLAHGLGNLEDGSAYIGRVGASGTRDSACRLGGVVSWCGLPFPDNVASQIGESSLGSRTPLLVVCGEADAQTPAKRARRLFQELTTGWERHRTPSPGRPDCAQPNAEASAESPSASSPEQTLHLLTGKGQAMVGSPAEARLLMEFFARHLALSSALEDDPNVIRMS